MVEKTVKLTTQYRGKLTTPGEGTFDALVGAN